MIEVTRLNGASFFLNCELIKFIEATPDTVITLTTGEKFMVKESVETIVESTFQYRKKLYQNLFSLSSLSSLNLLDTTPLNANPLESTNLRDKHS